MSAVAVDRYDDYVSFCESVHALTGIDLLQYKRGQMERRLRAFAERRGASGLDDYLTTLRADPAEVDLFLDRVTINVSQLWRNPEQWATVGRVLVPELAESGRIRAWSAGCSYGAESYTLAAVCLDAAPSARVSVLGTDIDRRMLARAEAGVFSQEDARTAPPEALRRWFAPAPEGWSAGPELHRAVSFEQGDLLRMRFPAEAYDLVLCRNVVIYFNEDVRDELHRRLAESLRPGGYLVIGSTERVANTAAAGLAPVHPFVYRRR